MKASASKGAARKGSASKGSASKGAAKRGLTLAFKFSHVAVAAYLCLLVPICIFFIGWLRWYYALSAIALLGLGAVWLYRADYRKRDEKIEVPIVHFVAIVVLFGLYVAMSGNCGFSVAMYDIGWRNALVSDLIAYPWPVHYLDGYALTYYIVFWMVPALAGKLGGWGAAMFTMWLQETLILTLAFLLISHIIKAERAGQFWLIAIFMMLFSGLNLVGSAVTKILGTSLYGFNLDSNEAYLDFYYNGEAVNFYYRSNIDCIEESYNQIVIWLAVPLMMDNRKIHSYVFLGLLLAAFSPWATIGLIPLMLCLGVVELRGYIKKHGGKASVAWVLREVFSVPNVLVLIGCALPLLAYFVTGSTISGDAPIAENGGASFGFLTLSIWNKGNWITYFLFLLCEFGIFTMFMARKNARDPFFWTNVVWLCLIPLMWIGRIGGRDFCMDVSLPGLYIVMIYLITYADQEVIGKPMGLASVAFTVVITVAMMSPVFGLCYQAETMHEKGSLSVTDIYAYSTSMTTLEGQDLGNIYNFISVDPEDTFFYQHLAKPLG